MILQQQYFILSIIFVAPKGFVMDFNQITITELSELTSLKKYQVSNAFKDASKKHVTRVNNRVTGITPDGAEKFLLANDIDIFTLPSVTMVANLCGGVGKTTCVYALATAIRRVSGLKSAIVMIDGDSQGSLSRLSTGKQADDDELTLVDYVEGRAKLKDILTDLGSNVWLIKANLSLVVLDKSLSKPKDTKEKILKLYMDIFKKLGPSTKILQDHGPQLSNLFASSVCALHQLPDEILKTILIPIRSDDFAIQGAEIILKEIDEILPTFSVFNDLVNIRCFFSNIDKRVSSTAQAIKVASSKERIIERLCDTVIRYSSEVPKSIMSGNNLFHSVHGSKSKSKASQDFSQLLVELFSYDEVEFE